MGTWLHKSKARFPRVLLALLFFWSLAWQPQHSSLKKLLKRDFVIFILFFGLIVIKCALKTKGYKKIHELLKKNSK